MSQIQKPPSDAGICSCKLNLLADIKKGIRRNGCFRNLPFGCSYNYNDDINVTQTIQAIAARTATAMVIHCVSGHEFLLWFHQD